MLGQKKVDALRNDWNERAAKLFIEASQVTDPEAAARNRGMAETLAICSQELKAADAKEE